VHLTQPPNAFAKLTWVMNTIAEAALSFVQAINRQNPESLAALMTEDHVLTDGLGARIEGRSRVTEGKGYFRMVPDYTITVAEVFEQDPVVVMLGTAQGTYSRDGVLRSENYWTTPVALRAKIRDGLVAEWRVYADNDPIRKIMARDAK
jgi:ketosteroid isomerase-like protein